MNITILTFRELIQNLKGIAEAIVSRQKEDSPFVSYYSVTAE